MGRSPRLGRVVAYSRTFLLSIACQYRRVQIHTQGPHIDLGEEPVLQRRKDPVVSSLTKLMKETAVGRLGGKTTKMKALKNHCHSGLDPESRALNAHKTVDSESNSG